MVRTLGDVDARERLRRSESLLDAIVEHSPAAIYAKDRQGRFILNNTGSARLFGRSRAEMLGATDFDIMPREMAERIHGNDLQVMSSGGPLQSEESIVTDGEVRTYLSVKFPLVAESGEIEGVGGISTDITDRIRMEAELAFRSALLDSAADAIIVFTLGDDPGRIVYANRAAYEARGFTADEFLALPVSRLIAPSHRDMLPGSIERVEAGEEVSVESRQLRKDGSTFPVELRIRLFERDGERLALNVSRDISNRKRAEEARADVQAELDEERRRLREIVENTSVGVALVDAGGAILEVNEVTDAMWAGTLPRARSIEEFRLYHGWHRDTGQPITPEEWPAARAIRTGERVEEIVEIERLDGTHGVVRIEALPITDGEGKVARVVVISEDVSEREERRILSETLAEIERVVHSTLSLEEVLRRTVRLACEAIGAEAAVIETPGPSGWTVEYEAGAVEQARGEPLTKTAQIARMVEESGEILVSEDVEHDAAFSREAWSGRPVRSLIAAPLTARDRAVGTLIVFERTQRRRYSEAVREFVRSLSSSVSLAIENARLFEAEQAVAARNAALNRIHALLLSTLDVDELLTTLVDEASVAAGVEMALLVQPRGDEWEVTHVHNFPDELRGSRFHRDYAYGTQHTAEMQRPVLVEDALKDSRFNRDFAERYGMGSFLLLPLVVRGETIGVLNLARPFAATLDERDVEFARGLSSAVSLALENARTYAEEHDIADTLQEAILAVPEHIEGLEFGVLYRSATEAAQVGGDFYDLFELGGERVGLLLGDVSGKGVQAAALTSLVKNTVRAYAHEVSSPASVMAKTNDVVFREVPSNIFVTVFFAVLDVATGALVYCNAGHPPALLRRVGDRVERLGATGPIIGAFHGLTFEEERTDLGEQDLLLLYTDGAIEARSGKELYGEERLTDAFCTAPEAVRALPAHLYERVLAFADGHLSDDIALLALRRSGHSEMEG